MKNTILLVDDDDKNLELLKQALESDYALLLAKNGLAALKLAHEKPDLILLDIMMPGMDGYEVCRRLKANEQTKEIPIILISDEQAIADEIDGLKIGAADYIAKPLNISVLKARVKNHLTLRVTNGPEQDDNAVPTPLNKLKLPVNEMVRLARSLLKDDSLSVEQRKSLTILQNHGANALHMINQFLFLFQIEQGTYKPKPSNFDLLPIFLKIQANFRPLLSNKKLTLSIQVKDKSASQNSPFFVRAEPTLCYSMLANLIKNALEASPQGQAIKISLQSSGEMGLVQIHNLGSVPKNIRDRFFEKHPTTGENPEIGLGNYFAKLCAEAQGGRIRMRTDDIKGTMITVSIPKGTEG